MLKDFFTRKRYATLAVGDEEDKESLSGSKQVDNINKDSNNTSYDKTKDSRIKPRKVIGDIIDEGTFLEYDKDLESSNPLDFPIITLSLFKLENQLRKRKE